MRYLMLVFVSLALLGCVTGQTSKTFDDVLINPKSTIIPARLKAKSDLKIVLGLRVRNNVTVIRAGGKLVINITNYRNAIQSRLQKAFEGNFASVLASPRETKKGLELILLDAKISKKNDTMDYSAVLTEDGKDIIEMRDTIKPPTRVIHTDVTRWLDDTKKVTVEYIESNIAEVIKAIYGKIMVNSQLNQFWRKYR